MGGLRAGGSLGDINSLRDSITKHGEVSFPTQVRYDIVFVIGPLIVILALLCREQLLCQHGKNLKKHRDNIFFYRSREQYPMKSVTEMHWGVTKLHSAR